MKCVIPSQNVKVLSRALHALARIGDDLFVEPHSDSLSLRTVNMAQSAYASFTFAKCFFSVYNYTEGEASRCKIHMKSCLTVFKTANCMDRQVEWCQLRLSPDPTALIVQIRYIQGCIKTQHLPVVECETLEVNYSVDNVPNKLTCIAKLLATTVRNFRVDEDEVTLTVSAMKAIIKNHVEGEQDIKKLVRTEICLEASEFEEYHVKLPGSITFCLKELRAVVTFSESANLPITIAFETTGRPAVFIVNNKPAFEANFVVSTLCGSNSQELSQVSVTTSQGCEPLDRNKADKRKRSHDCTDSVANASNRPRVGIFRTEDLCNSEVGLLAERGDAPMVDHTQPIVGDKSKRTEILTTVFAKCFNATQHLNMLPGYSQVLAYDSDGMQDSD